MARWSELVICKTCHACLKSGDLFQGKGVEECQAGTWQRPLQPELTRALQVLMGPGVECKDETGIFRALGLEYVPPHMRWFHEWQ